MRTVLATLGGAGAVLLGLTGLAGWIMPGPIGGWVLLAHVSAAPLLLVGLLSFAVALAERHARRSTPAGQRWAYWLTLASGWFACAVIVAAMFPWFGSAEQERIYWLHRWSSLVFLVAAAGLVLTCCGPRRSGGTQA